MKHLRHKITVTILAMAIALSGIFATTTVYAAETIPVDTVITDSADFLDSTVSPVTNNKPIPDTPNIDTSDINISDTETSDTNIPDTETSPDIDTPITMEKSYIVVLDPGHGAAGTGTYREYDGFVIDEAIINLKISQYTKEALETNYKNITVYLTRTTQNENPTLKERVGFAVSKNADVLVSQHVNATAEKRTNVNGVMAMVPTVDANHTFNKNAAIFSQTLARHILDKLVLLDFTDKGFLYKLSMDNTLYPDGSLADYYGIIRLSRENNLPGTIIEHGFANNEGDALKLNDEEMLKKIGEADAKGIVTFLTENPEFGTVSSSLRGWKNVGAEWVYYNEQGQLVYGWQYIDQAWYYFTASGKMQTSWLWDGNAWYYLNASGVMQTGWLWYGDAWYYLDASGKMQTGWVLDGNNWYYLNASGVMQTGWVLDGNNWYYLNASGVMQTGWVLDSNNWYYLAADGVLQTGWQYIGGTWYYLNASGIMQTGWLLDGSNWYYLNAGGIMQTGWQYINGTWYYFYDSGVMATGTVMISGTTYKFNASGSWIE